jgi:hypothetical protein
LSFVEANASIPHRPDSFSTVAAMRSALRCFLFDLACVVVFVVIGRRSHDEGSAVVGALKVMAPFAIGLTAAWLSAWRVWATRPNLPEATAGDGVGEGLFEQRTFALRIWVVTLVVGLGLRRLVFDRGIAPGFVIVATLFLGVTFFGWRMIAIRLRQRRSAPAASAP